MAGFHTKIVVPDDRSDTRGLFKVVIPSFFLIGTAIWLNAYFQMNGYPVPAWMGIPLFTFVALWVMFIWYRWWHNHFDHAGYVDFKADGIDYEWRDSGKKHFNIDEVSDIKVVYDGHAGLTSSKRGTMNQVSFKHKGQEHGFNFLLASQDDAEELGAIMKKWYEAGKTIAESDTSGAERYLMMYAPQKA